MRTSWDIAYSIHFNVDKLIHNYPWLQIILDDFTTKLFQPADSALVAVPHQNSYYSMPDAEL